MPKPHEDIDLSFLHLETTKFLPLLWVPPINIPGIFTAEQFILELQSSDYDYVDCCVYSASANFGFPIRKLITTHNNNSKAKQVKQVAGTHAKFYVAYKKHKVKAAYIGSLNAVDQTAFELIVRCTNTQTKKLKYLFDSLWD